jgi:hypothetical protein
MRRASVGVPVVASYRMLLGLVLTLTTALADGWKLT